jgi:amino acid adenylation domain-containing protein/FkbH-like protein
MRTGAPSRVTLEPTPAPTTSDPQPAGESHQLRLSFAQQRLWFLDQLEPNTPLYNVASLARLEGRLNLAALELAFNTIVDRHEALRTRFVCEEGSPRPHLDATRPIELRLLDLSSLDSPLQHATCDREIHEEVNRPFLLHRGPLIRTTLLRLAPERHLLLLVLHHIVADEWSLRVLYQEFTQLYRSYVQGKSAALPELPIQYSDFAEWQQEWLQGERLDRHLSYWRQQLAGFGSPTALPTNQARRNLPSFRGAHEKRELPAGVGQRVAALATAQKATPFMVFLAALKVLLYRYTHQEDLVIACPLAGRNRVETEPLIGFFVNALPFRTRIAGNQRFNEVVARVRETAVGAFAHQDLPFERLVAELQPERSLSHLAFTNVMLVFQGDGLEPISLPGLEVTFLDVAGDTAKFEITVLVKMSSARVSLEVEYNSDLFDRPTAARLLEHLQNLLVAALERPDQRVSELAMLSEPERRQVLRKWNETQTEYSRHKSVHQLFEEQVLRQPNSVAAHFSSQTITYAELNRRANQLARYLKRHQVGRDVPVAVCVRPGLELLVAVLGVLKAGGAYVPLDPGYPPDRLAFMVQDTGAPVLLTESGLLSRLRDSTATAVCLDTGWAAVTKESCANLNETAEPESLAYVMYTSGSTGRPKGVAVPHRAINRLVLNTDYIQLDASDRIAQVSNISFDAATFEIWGALLNGATLVGISREVLLSPESFARELKAQEVTAMFLTAALFNQMAAEVPNAFESLRTLIVGGEALDPKWVRTVLHAKPPQRLLNGYGPTENTTFTCWHHIRDVPEGAAQIPIGRPIANTQVYILDPALNPVPVGVTGELYVAGEGLARGYWNRPELTAERFIRQPVSSEPGCLLYRTGDFARFRPSGEIEFLGRADNQVKIRGFRIELGEIEAVLGQHTEVQQCVVSVHADAHGEKRLLAHVRLAEGSHAEMNQLRDFVRNLLPDYMVPATFVRVSAFPVTANGKIDRHALPSPEAAPAQPRSTYVAPRDAVETQLCLIWEQVLEVRPVGIADGFFELGGHSLLAVRLVAAIEKRFDRKLRVATVFQAATIEQQAALLREEVSETGVGTSRSLVGIQTRGTRAPLFLIHGAGGGMFWGYANLARRLGPDQPVYGFKPPEGHSQEESLEDMAAAYLRDVRKVQPRGPYYLGGYCFGGVVAYEMARQLTAQRDQVALLALFNCAPPNSSYFQIPWTLEWAFRLARNTVYWAKYCLSWTAQQRREFLRWKWSLLKKRMRGRRRAPGDKMARVEAGDLVDLSSYPEEQRGIWETHLRALFNYQPRPYSGCAHLFRSPGHPLWCSFDTDYGWGKLTLGEVRVTVVPGAHEKILQEPCVSVLAVELAHVMNGSMTSEPSGLEKTPPGSIEAGGLHSPAAASATAAPPGAARNSGTRAVRHSVVAGDPLQLPADSTYPAQFYQRAAEVPSSLAARFEGRDLTYAELDRKSNQLAHFLQQQGVGPDVLVGLCLERSLELPIALLAVLKAGGAYLPLDPHYPADRLQYMLEDSQATLLLTQSRLAPSLPRTQTRSVCLDDPDQLAQIERCASAKPTAAISPENLAYVIYTSGSTGAPKGVEITHRSLLNHNLAMAQAFKLSSADRVLQFAPLSFDISVEEIFPTWLAGGAVVLRNDEVIASGKGFLRFLENDRISVLDLPTAYWHELAAHLDDGQGTLPSCVRLVVIGGEKASESAYARWKRRVPSSVVLLNTYGTTETTVTSTLHQAHPEDGALPIGRPIPNTCALILDDRQQPVPWGAEGELHLGGTGLARGYLRRPQLTTQRFISNPCPNLLACPRLYKTGDRARLRQDGGLEFIGRSDDQIKLRGYRVELGEIEAVLLAHPGIKEAAVLVREDQPGRRRLVAYWVPAQAPGPDPGEVLAFVRRKLPSYMVPAAFVLLSAFPLSPAGKVDRRALPAPGPTRPVLDQDYVAPRLPLEEVLVAIWVEVLGVDRVGVLDNFLDLGGDSLLAIQVLSRIRETLKVEIPLGTFLKNPTVAELAAWSLEKCDRSPQLPAAILNTASAVSPSAKQRRVWALEQFFPHLSPDNLPLALRLRGPLEREFLEQSLTALVKHHPALRAVFPAEHGIPGQWICGPGPVVLPVIDLSALPPAERERAALTLVAERASRPFISFHPAFRPMLFRLAPDEHWLILVLHTIIADRRSLGLVLRDVVSLYGALSAGRSPSVSAERVPYPELLCEEERLSPEEEQSQLSCWLRRLEGAPELLDLPLDRPRPAGLSGAGARQAVSVPEDLTAALQRFAVAENSSLFAVLLAAFSVLLHRYSRAEDIVIGSLASRQTPQGWENCVANLETPVALRCDLSGEPTFRELLSRIARVIDEAWANCKVPFAKVVEQLPSQLQGSFSRVFQIAFVLEESPLVAACAGGLTFEPFEVQTGTSKLDLSLHLANGANGLSGWIEYSTDLFEASRISRLARHWLVLLGGAVAQASSRISRLPLLDESELHQVLVEWNQTHKEYEASKTLADLFLEQADRTPNAEALVAGTERLTYRQLQTRAQEVASELKRRRIGADDLVGLCLERTPHLVSSMLGTLMAGAAYVPLDPSYPRERLVMIAREAKLRLVLGQDRFRDWLPDDRVPFVAIDRPLPAPHSLSLDESPRPRPTDLAYVIYTSGSTGVPKGVALEHRNAVAFVAWATATFTGEELAGVLASTSICFDLSVFEIFVPLSCGGKVILADNALALPSLPATCEVSLVNTVPSAMKELLRAKAIPDSVSVVNLAGEPLSTALADQIYRQTAVRKVYDLYGPTETTTYSTGGLRLPGAAASIGRPLANERVYLLDGQLQPVPIGVPGELFIGGAGVARGYLHRPDLTAARFLPDPFRPGERLYRTGDLARWTQFGHLEFLGRLDHQVKIRGFRIELGEVEAALRALDGVQEVVVMARGDQPSDLRLVAYLVADPQKISNTDRFRESLQARLPAYMVPSAFVLLQALPLTPNGKVDRKRLPAPDTSVRKSGMPSAPPRNPVEEQLVRIWAEVLRVPEVGTDDNFFELGGHSLQAAQVASRIREQFNVEMPLIALFSAPTIRALGEALAVQGWAPTSSRFCPEGRLSPSTPQPVSFVQERLWFLDQLRPGGCAYNVPAALRLKGELNVTALRTALKAVMARHQALRTVLRYDDGQLVQVILPGLELDLVLRQAEEVGSGSRDEELQQWLSSEAQRPFDLSTGPLIRASLLRLNPSDHCLIVVMHHVICDGWSLAVLFQELAGFYRAAGTGQPAPELSEPSVQYVDYAHWQRQTLQGAKLASELAYWTKKLASAPPTLDLPTDHSGSEDLAVRAGRRTVCLQASLQRGMVESGRQDGITPFMWLTAGLLLTLHHWTRQSDLVLGTVVAGRNHRELESLIGCFMNFLPLRMQVAGSDTGREILSRVRTCLLEAHQHQDCPFEKIVEAVNPERRLDRNPLYNVAFLLQNFPAEPFQSPRLQVASVPVTTGAALLDLRFEAEQVANGLSLSCEYRVDLFEPETIDELLRSFEQVLSALVQDPQAKASTFGITTGLQAQARAAQSRSERQTLVVAATFTAEPLAEPLHYWLKAAELHSAVEFAPYHQVFQQLLDPAGSLAGNSHGLNLLLIRFEDWARLDDSGPNDFRSRKETLLQTVEEFVGALDAAARRSAVQWLVVLCPPSKRARDLGLGDDFQKQLVQLLQTRCRALTGVQLLTPPEIDQWYPVADPLDPAAEELAHVPYTQEFFTALAAAVTRKLHALTRPPYKVIVLDCDQTLWSGVCGEDGPDGVCLDPAREALQQFMRRQHQSGMLLCLNSKNHEDDVRSVFTRRSDMPLQWEHFAGWQLNWQPKSENLKALARQLQLGLDSFIFIDDNPLECAEVEANCPPVLTLQLPEDPSLISSFLNHCWAFDRPRLTSEDEQRAGRYRENLRREALRAKAPSLADFLAGLGLVVELDKMSSEQLPRVAQLSQRTNQFNSTARRVTESDLQQAGADQEILTARVRDRFGDYGLVGAVTFQDHRRALDVTSFLLSCRALGRGVEHRVLAKLGKIARDRGAEWVDIHFIATGRNKPALDFLESVGAPYKQALNGGYVFRFPAAVAAEVAFRPGAIDVPFATPVGQGGGPTRSDAPCVAKFSRCRELALKTMNLAAAQGEIENRTRPQPGNHGPYVAPRTSLERQLCELWQRLLRVETVGIRDNFFDLGGHSLLAVRLFADIERIVGRKLPLVTLFQATTIEQLAPLLDSKPEPSGQSLLVPIQPRGAKPPLFLVHGAGGDVLWGYANLANHLPPDQPVYGIKSRVQVGLDEYSSLREMAHGYLQVVRELQPHGPYLLGGYCFGGNVAYEMARQFMAEGESVALVALLDSAPSNAGYERIPWWRPGYLWRFGCNFYEWLKDFAALPSADRSALVRRKLRACGRKLRRRWTSGADPSWVDIEDVIDPRHFPEHELRLWQLHLQELVQHVDGAYDGAVALLRTRGQPLLCSLEDDFCWGKLVRGGVRLKLIPGSHESIFVEPNVKELAQTLTRALEVAQGPHSASETSRNNGCLDPVAC